METKITTIENPKQVKVKLEKTETFKQGLKTTSKVGKIRPGYEIVAKQCIRCGLISEFGANDKEECGKCHGTSFTHAHSTMRPDQVEKIINTKLKYKCKTCGAEYDTPTPCCNENHAWNKKDIGKWIEGYRCSSCSKVYKRVVECCFDGEMIKGKVLIKDPESKILVPVG